MSQIDKLILNLCPTGVVFASLGDVVRIRNGKDYKLLGPGNVPVYGTGGIMTYVDRAAYDLPSVLIPRKGSLNKLYYVEVPFWTVDTIFFTEIGDRLIPKFFYYYLHTRHLEDMNQAGGVPSLTQSELNVLRIPVPPIEVQQEIVDVLDSFSNLEAELETELVAELESRRSQYSFYRDRLFASVDGAKVLMGDVGVFARGRRFTKADVIESGIPAIHYGEIYTDYGVSTDFTVTHVRTELRDQLRFAEPGDVVIATVGETVEDVAKAVAWLGKVPVAVHDDTAFFRSHLNPKYVSYAMQTADFHTQKNKHVARGKVKRLSGDGLSKIAIPMPPREEQDRIVAILDKFDALVNGLSIGLCAELKARRQQYEHYRDRLLTFPEAI